LPAACIRRRRAPLRIALISDHASPLAAPGSVDCGGQNVYVANLARELAQAGHAVDVFTRRDAPGSASWCKLAATGCA
jgi:hypothetical protein